MTGVAGGSIRQPSNSVWLVGWDGPGPLPWAHIMRGIATAEDAATCAGKKTHLLKAGYFDKTGHASCLGMLLCHGLPDSATRGPAGCKAVLPPTSHPDPTLWFQLVVPELMGLR